MNKKKIIGLCVGLVVVIGLIVFLVFLPNILPDGDAQNESSALNEGITLIEKNSNEVASILVENESGNYEVVKGDGDNFKLVGFENLPVYSNYLVYLAGEVTSLSAIFAIEDESRQNLSDYGLDKPIAKATAKYTDGTELEITVGIPVPTSTTARYVKLSTSENVYAVYESGISYFLKNKLSYLDKALIPASSTEGGPNITKFMLSGTSLKTPIIIERDENQSEQETQIYLSDLTMVSPVKAAIDTTVYSGIVSPLFGATATDIVAAYPTEEELKEYGLYEAYSILDMIYDSTSAKIKVGNKTENGNYYVLFNDNNIVYEVMSSIITWVDIKPEDLISKSIFMSFIDNMETMNFKVNGVSYNFTLTGESEELKVTCNGKEIDTDKFRDFYKLVIMCYFDSVCENPSGGLPTMMWEFKYRAGATVYYAFIPVEGRRYEVLVDGKSEFLVKESYVEHFIKNIAVIAENGDVNLIF